LHLVARASSILWDLEIKIPDLRFANLKGKVNKKEREGSAVLNTICLHLFVKMYDQVPAPL